MGLTERLLRELADPRSWERGVGYFEDGRVRGLVQDGTTVVAKVEGQQTYRVTLALQEGQLLAECTCPMGQAGVFCKHCVAVGLACVQRGIQAPPSSQADNANAASSPTELGEDTLYTDLDRLREYLFEQSPSTLVEIIIEQALWDDKLLRQLTMRAAHGGEAVDMKAMRRAITEATRTGRFVDYHSAPSFARGIEDVVKAISQLLKEGRAHEVIQLSEYALRRVERALEGMDDSDGYMGPILDDLQALHHAACVAAKPDPIKLARRIFKWEVTGDWDTFFDAAETYADVFGEEGLAEYRKLAETLWEKMPQLGPDQDREAYQGPRFRLTAIMESLARANGDVEALVGVKSRDLSSSYCYLDIAQTYKEVGEHDKALEWAEKGVKAFPHHTDHRLREFLAEEYHRRRRHDAALALIWQNFVERSSLDSYKALKQHADRIQEWPRWRKQALAHLKGQKRTEGLYGRKVHWTMGPLCSHSGLVGVFLWEEETDAAWEEACQNGCSSDQWLKLASLREAEHPDDAVCIYQDEIRRLVEQTNNAAYEEAFRLVQKIRKLRKDMGLEDQFDKYIGELRSEYKRKRNFMKLLDTLK